MRIKTQSQLTQVLNNGIAIKGTYRFHFNGMYLDVFVIASDGTLLGNRQLKYDVAPLDPVAAVKLAVDNLKINLQKAKVDTFEQPRILAAVVPAIIDATFKA